MAGDVFRPRMNMHDGDVDTGSPSRNREKASRLLRALAMLLCVIIGGSLGFMSIEGWSFAESLYFTIITITTVGFGDHGISEPGRMFTIILMLGGISVATYCFGLVIQHLVTDESRWRLRMQRKIEKLSGHTIVCGYGRMGQIICRELRDAGLHTVVIDRDPEIASLAVDDAYLVVEGAATEDHVLQAAGIVSAGNIVICMGPESENIVTSLSARDLAPDITIIARAEKDEEIRKLRRAGADRVVSPFRSGGHEVADAIIRPKVAEFLARTTRCQSELALAEVGVGKGSFLEGSRLREYGIKHGHGISFIAIERQGGEVLIPPSGADSFRAGDLLIVAGDVGQIGIMSRHAEARTESRQA